MPSAHDSRSQFLNQSTDRPHRSPTAPTSSHVPSLSLSLPQGAVGSSQTVLISGSPSWLRNVPLNSAGPVGTVWPLMACVESKSVPSLLDCSFPGVPGPRGQEFDVQWTLNNMGIRDTSRRHIENPRVTEVRPLQMQIPNRGSKTHTPLTTHFLKTILIW